MKITTFNPQIFTNDAKAVTRLFEELGFTKAHNPTGIGDLNVEGIRMKDANGFALDISQPEMQLPQDLVGIRINVDDFDEAYQLLLARGFKNVYGDRIIETGSAKSAMMISSTGYGINLVQHIK
ncbi:hypothetical protein SAMN02910456_02200 [Ruminococcaceae bacterium YRB3002]|nr:hypothetical protein SAMN02910456_02200 [Ruminococcaceae bacterium YRB3002]